MELALGLRLPIHDTPATATPEAALLARALGGDHRAFEALVRQHQDGVLNVARRMVFDADAAQDVAQEAFIKAYTELHRFRGEAKFSTWLYRITVNEALSYLRGQRRRQAQWEKLAGMKAAEPQSAPRAEEAAPLLALMRELPEKQRAALALFYLEELSLMEIAQAVGAPTGTVKAWLSRGREKLRQLARQRGLL